MPHSREGGGEGRGGGSGMFGQKRKNAGVGAAAREEYAELTPIEPIDFDNAKGDVEAGGEPPGDEKKPPAGASAPPPAAGRRKRVSMRRVGRMLYPETWRLAVGFVFLGVSSLAAVLIPQYLGGVIEATTANDRGALNRAALEVVALSMVSGVAGFFRSWLFTLSGHRIVAHVRKGHVWERLGGRASKR